MTRKAPHERTPKTLIRIFNHTFFYYVRFNVMIVVSFVFSFLCQIFLLLTCMKLFAFCFIFRALRVRVTTACYVPRGRGRCQAPGCHDFLERSRCRLALCGQQLAPDTSSLCLAGLKARRTPALPPCRAWNNVTKCYTRRTWATMATKCTYVTQNTSRIP